MAKSTPKNPKLWAATKAAAKQKFDVYPCVPLNSLAVTPEGLATCEELQDSLAQGIRKFVLAYDIGTDHLVWSKLVQVHTFDEAPTVEMYKKTGFSLVCTPGHSWVVERELSTGGKPGPKGTPGIRFLDRQLILTENLNTHMDLVWCGRPLAGSGFEGKSWHKHQDWVSAVLEMTPDQREVFLASAIIYDGCDQGESAIRDGRTFGFTQKNLNHYYAAVLAAFCNGYYVSMYQKTEDIKGATLIRGKRTHNTQNLHVRPALTQPVWCPETEHGTWVMLQDKVVCVTGNSAYANAWAAKEYKKKGGAWGGADNRVKKK